LHDALEALGELPKIKDDTIGITHGNGHSGGSGHGLGPSGSAAAIK
jgi:hypothetical protein